MKKFYLLLFSLIGLFSCSETVKQEETKQSNVEKKELSLMAQNKVKTKEAKAFEFRFGEPNGKGVVMYKNSYSVNGVLSDSTVYNNGELAFTEKYHYNEELELIKRVVVDSTGKELQVSERNMDSNGNEISFSIISGDSVFYKQNKEYDGDNLVKMTEYDSKGITRAITLFEYNESGDVTSAIETDANGRKLSKVLNSYDADGNRTSIATYNASGLLEGKTFLKNFIDGKAQMVEKYDANDSLYASYQYEYNELGLETKSVIFNGVGQIIRQSNATYDSNGNKLSFEIYEGEVGFLGKDVLKYNDQNQEIELQVLDGNNEQVKRRERYYNDKGLLEKEITYNKIDEPIYQFVYTYAYFE